MWRTLLRALPLAERERLSAVRITDAGHGYDLLGMHADGVAAGALITHLAYERYFRVTSHGAEHIPSSGRAILAANHSGMLPIDGLMLWADVMRHTRPPRVPRVVVDLFVPLLPSLSTLFARAGAIDGTRPSFRHLLEHEELIIVFPEGTPGIGKGFARRYQLQGWRVGHVEMAIRYRAPVVPVAVIGAEEAWPQLARLDGLAPFGAPYLPVPATPLPLPARFHLRYGPAIDLASDHPPSDADDPEALAAAAARVRAAVEALIAEGLAARQGVFR
jgi:1-acyl-sn-glycerol-3-phosphate acyltransferase